jgi:HD-GYP domain-containing protein (c-di-GMP phosphodiesterase class II)
VCHYRNERIAIVDYWSYLADPILEGAMAAHDLPGAEHCERVARFAVRLGRRLDLPAHDLAVLGLAGRLHDVGKIGLPDALLRKQGPLDAEEWTLMQTHSAIGERILLSQRDIPFHAEVARIVRHHHEHWDGSGYPDRLQGADIPLLARVLSVIDSYDALTSGRPYHAARAHSVAIGILQVERGIKHDPVILDLFVRHDAEIRSAVSRPGVRSG